VRQGEAAVPFLCRWRLLLAVQCCAAHWSLTGSFDGGGQSVGRRPPLAAAAAAAAVDADAVAAMLPASVECRRRGVVDVISMTWTASLILTTYVLSVQGKNYVTASLSVSVVFFVDCSAVSTYERIT